MYSEATVTAPVTLRAKPTQGAVAEKPQKKMALAAFAFEARNEDELPFSPSDRIELLEQPDGGWWKGGLALLRQRARLA